MIPVITIIRRLIGRMTIRKKRFSFVARLLFVFCMDCIHFGSLAQFSIFCRILLSFFFSSTLSSPVLALFHSFRHVSPDCRFSSVPLHYYNPIPLYWLLFLLYFYFRSIPDTCVRNTVSRRLSFMLIQSAAVFLFSF